MGLRVGSVNISKIYLGNTEIKKAYLGSLEVFGGLKYIVELFKQRVLADSGTIESLQCLDNNLDVVPVPVITLLGVNPFLVDVGGAYNDAGATAFDEFVYGDVTSRIITTNSVDTNTPNLYEVKYNIVDLDGQTASEVIREVYVTSVLSNRFRNRAIADGAVVESLNCTNAFDQHNWSFYFRVLDDGGTIESLECVTI